MCTPAQRFACHALKVVALAERPGRIHGVLVEAPTPARTISIC